MGFSEFTTQVTQISPSSVPGRIWAVYLEYLWHYQSDSWVARIAYTARVLAVLISLPIIVLGLLDITSYILARTLGVVDDVKASTSDKASVLATRDGAPSIRVQGDSAKNAFADSTFSLSDTSSDRDSVTEHEHDVHNPLRTSRSRSSLGISIPDANDVNGSSGSLPTVFYAGGEGHHFNNLRLSGVGVFSPATSQPPSPTITRQQLAPEVKDQLRHRNAANHAD